MKRSLITIFVLAGIVLSSCNLPGSTSVQPDIMTAAALTVQAALAVTPLASPTAGSPASTASTEQATPTFSNTFSKPMASVGDVTNCRSGPSKDYERIAQIQPNQPVEIIGYYPPNYWVVNSQQGPCWLIGDFTTPSGSLQTVPTVTAPSTPNGKTPAAPAFPKNGWTYFCNGNGQTDVTFNWVDKADNETGYRIYRDNVVIAELPANSTQFSESINLLSGKSTSYKIEAYNAVGSASTPVITIGC